MSIDYYDRQASTLALMEEYGQPITLTKVTTGTYNPLTSTVSRTTIDEQRYGLVFDYNDYLHGIQEAVRSTIEVGDRRCFLNGNGSSIGMNDLLVIGGVTWSIKNIKKVDAGGVVVMYDLHIRK